MACTRSDLHRLAGIPQRLALQRKQVLAAPQGRTLTLARIRTEVIVVNHGGIELMKRRGNWLGWLLDGQQRRRKLPA